MHKSVCGRVLSVPLCSFWEVQLLDHMVRLCLTFKEMVKLFSKDIVSFGEDNGTPLQYFCLKNPMDGGAW